MEKIDPDTNLPHISPLGMEHHERRKKGKGLWYSDIKIRHYITCLHQQAFLELAEEMRKNPSQAANIYSAFLSIIPLEIKGKLTPELKKKIFKTYKVI